MARIRNRFLLFFFIIVSTLIPLTNVLEKNLRNKAIGMLDILPAIFFLFFLYLIIFLFVKFITKKTISIDQKTIITSCVFYFIFLYGVFTKVFYKTFGNIYLSDLSVEIIIFLIWFLGLYILYYFLTRLYSDVFKQVIFITFHLIFFINLFLIGNFYFSQNQIISNTELPNDIYSENKIKKVEFEKFPEIFFLIFDSYTSKEYIKYLYPDDNYKINDNLISKNFIVTENKLSHYNSTMKSIPTLFNSNYINDTHWLAPINFTSLWQSSYKKSDVKEILIDNNYIINSLYCGSNYSKKIKYCERTDGLSYLQQFDSSFIEAIFNNSALKYVLRFIFRSFNESQKIIIDNYEEIIEKLKNEDQLSPKFNFIHFQVPHPPYIFDSNCDFKKVPKDKVVVNNFLINDPVFLKHGYYDNYLCASKIIKNISKKIINHNKDAYVFIVSDHGPALKKDATPEDISYSDIMDKHAANISILVENSCKNKIEVNKISHVNLFRILMNCLSGSKNNLLPLKIYYNDYWGKNGQSKILTNKNLDFIKANNINGLK